MSIDESPRKPKHRSPSYPFIALDDAIEKARVIYQHEQRHATSWEVVVEHWGYKSTTSNGKLCLAALKKFGLLDEVDGGKSGKLKLSRSALAILLRDDPNEPDRVRAIRDAALAPRIHAELWEEWGANLPSDATMRRRLIEDWDFNDSYVNSFIKQYKRTLTFAGLDRESRLPDPEDVSTMEDDPGDESTSVRPIQRTAAAQLRETSTVQAAPTVQVSRPADFPSLASPAPVRVLSIPLEDGKTFDVRFPTNLSKEEFDFVIDNIKLWERTIVTKAKTATLIPSSAGMRSLEFDPNPNA